MFELLILDFKTIVFDLDETLIHCNESIDIPSDVILSIKFPTGEFIQVILIRDIINNNAGWY